MERRPVVAVGAVAVNDGAILLIRRGRPPAEGRWSLPGGRVEWGEPLTDALRREVEEETALRVEVGRLAGVVERIYGDAPARLRGDGGEPEAERPGAGWRPVRTLAQLYSRRPPRPPPGHCLSP